MTAPTPTIGRDGYARACGAGRSGALSIVGDALAHVALTADIAVLDEEVTVAGKRLARTRRAIDGTLEPLRLHPAPSRLDAADGAHLEPPSAGEPTGRAIQIGVPRRRDGAPSDDAVRLVVGEEQTLDDGVAVIERRRSRPRPQR